jgi:hypothetical protein
VEKPKANLLMLIEMRTLQNCSAYITKNVNDDPQSLVNSLIPHTWSEDGRDAEWKGRILSHADGIFNDIASEQANCFLNPVKYTSPCDLQFET